MELKLEECIKRFNESVYEFYLAEKSKNRSDDDHSLRSYRNAAEAISQAIEWLLKYYLSRHLNEREKKFLKYKPTIKDLIEKFIDDDGGPGNYFYSTIQNNDDPTVDFKFLLENKGRLTNYAKHNGEKPDIKTIQSYIEVTRNFIKEYIDPKARLNHKTDFEKNNSANWDLLYSTCDRFDSSERTLILVTGRNQNIDAHNLRSLSLPRWNLVIDFDYYSEKDGLYKAAFSTNDPPPHRYKISDNIDVNSFSPYSETHYHWFANNFAGSGETEITEFNEWNKKYAKRAEIFIKSFAEVLSGQKTIVLFLLDSRRHADALCRIIHQHFGNTTTFVFANDLKNQLEQVSEDWNGMKINISLTEIAEGLNDYSSNFGVLRHDSGKYVIPHMELSETKTSGELTLAEFAQLEEYFEVIHKGLPSQEAGEGERREFLTGSDKISWYGVKKGFDVQRKNFQKSFIKPLERIFENGRGKITLLHDAGFGGTTVSRRIAWHFHEEYPTLILKKYRDVKVKELLTTLHQKTRKTIFVVLEVPKAITLDDVDNLYQSISQARPIVFLIVKRGKPKSESDLVVIDWGNDVIELINAYKPYLDEYDNDVIRNRKTKELDEIIHSKEASKKTPFYVGLLTFEEDFFAIKDYIQKFCIDIINKEAQKKALLYLSICNDYIDQGLPNSFFKKLFKAERGEVLQLDKYFSVDSGIVNALLSSSQEGAHKFWRIKHNFFAKEIKTQLLSGLSDNPEIWRQGLTDICYNFIWDSVQDGNTPEYIQDVLQKLFIGNRKDRIGTDFTIIIHDIDSLDGKEKVFKALKDAYPENPHYCSHLARFYAYHNKNRELALRYADEAIQLSITAGNEDPLLYHIKGMCLRSNIYDTMEKHISSKRLNQPIQSGNYLEVLNILIPQCLEQFQLSIELNKRSNKSDEYGFVAQIQLLIRAIDYGIILSGKSKVDFFKTNQEPFSEWLDIAESLLEEVKRINIDDDESGKIEDCVNDILKFYENYEQILQNLRSQLDKGKNPPQTRRQIVRTYIRKKEKYFSDPKIIRNILSLMEANIDSEPDNEKNFYLWFQAARQSSVSLEEAIDKISKWNANSNAIDAVYYFYILKVMRALQGYSEAAQDAWNLIRECKQKGKSNIAIYEWFGKGSDLRRLVDRNDVSAENRDEKLQLVEGYFTEYFHDGSGRITIVDKLDVFFSPTQAKLTSGDLNQPVEFYLGFSHDGLRADSYSVRIKGSEPRNTEQLFDHKRRSSSTQPKHLNSEINIEKIKELKVLGKIDVSEKKVSKKNHRQMGKVVDMQRPPVYMWGKIQNEFGKHLIFHRDNEVDDVFNNLKIGDEVTYEAKQTDKGLVAFHIEIIR